MGGSFRITEVRQDGAALDDGTVDGGEGESFDWNERNQALPEDGWKLKRSQRISKTEYAGSDEATFQISGPTWDPTTLHGLWADRLGGHRFAVTEKNRFLRMHDRGNLVRIEHEEETLYGYVKNFEWDRKNGGEIRYSFEFWPSRSRIGREASAGAVQRRLNPAAARTALDLLGAAEEHVFSLQARAGGAPLLGFAGTAPFELAARVANLASAASTLRRSIELQATAAAGVASGGGAVTPGADALTLAARFAEVQTYGKALLPELEALSGEDVVAWDSAENLCGYESWARGSHGDAMLLVLAAWEAERELKARAQPNRARIHYPYAGQHLYSIAREYGVDWRTIMEDNQLETLVFEGGEALEIRPAEGA